MLFAAIDPLCRSPRPHAGWATLRTGIGRTVFLCLAAAWLPLAGGCARRAYTDVYIENMASEIRDLEDQLYEFDSEYRALEQELDALQSENARLRSGLASGSAKTEFGGGQRSFSQGSAAQTPQPLPGAAGSPGSVRPPDSQPSPAPSLEARPPLGREAPQDVGSGLAPTQPAVENPLSPSELPPPAQAPGAGESDPYDLKNLVPPTIEQGEAMPPTLPAPRSDGSAPLTLGTPSDLEVEVGQIAVPAQLASVTSDGPARMPVVAEMPRDQRIVEVKFHPSLCRAVASDSEGDDDALSLVLQPLNASGQFVPLPAQLLIVALDPASDNSQKPAGRWTLEAEDVQAKLQPIGSSQGIHLSLPLNGPKPQADRLVVFVYYTLPDGRRVVAEQEIFLNNAHRQHTVWVPRGKGSSAQPAVRMASGQRPVR